jgi:uracil-DNA glycosylase family 4
MMNSIEAQALEFLVDAGIDVAVMAEPNNRFANTPDAPVAVSSAEPVASKKSISPPPAPTMAAHAEVIQHAETTAKGAQTLDDLKQAIIDFDGLTLKKTANAIVFSDGNPEANIMVIGDVPLSDEDRQGIPFVGASGQLLDKIFDCIGLNRVDETPEDSIYITNIINWRPPGNRSVTAEEIEISLPFIKRHIELINPDLIVSMGGMPAQKLLGMTESISRLRGVFHDYNDTTKLLATYHPVSLINTPLQKKKVWQDILMVKDFMNV